MSILWKIVALRSSRFCRIWTSSFLGGLDVCMLLMVPQLRKRTRSQLDMKVADMQR